MPNRNNGRRKGRRLRTNLGQGSSSTGGFKPRKTLIGPFRPISQAFPEFVDVSLSYVAPLAFTVTSGAGSYYVFTGNGLFDPDVTGSGSQPYWFDQLATLYARYVCTSSTISVYASSTTISIPDNLVRFVVMPCNSSGSLAADYNAVLNSPLSKSMRLQYYTGAEKDKTVKNAMSTAKIAGTLDAAVLTEVNYSALISANPSHLWFWHIYMNSLNLSASTSATAEATLVYKVRFYQRNQPASS